MIDAPLGVVDLLAIGVVAGGSLIAAVGGRRYRRLRAVTRRAVETTGTINRVTIQRVNGSGGSQSYVPVVDYEYRTPTERRDGTTVYPGNSRFAKQFGTESAAETVVADYEPDTQTTVYYDPDEPAHAFLIAEPQTAQAITTVVIGLTVLLGGGVLFMA
ncbi:DUF3592 domain-containing protein [Halonotius sp. F2-221B]|uniref:DUF3592 domain-containing protein n=1 Tax=Halonotius sp. F2-221B TaxID=2731620 RepID=UPI00398B2110